MTKVRQWAGLRVHEKVTRMTEKQCSMYAETAGNKQ